jgi:uncharacterized protein
MITTIARAARRSLWEQVPRDHRESPRALRRRQVVTTCFAVVGAVVLAGSLRLAPGDGRFYPATLALAAVWTVGAFASGPLHLGRTPRGTGAGARPLVMPAVWALLLALLFVVGGLVVRQVPWLDHQVHLVVEHATRGTTAALLLVTAVNGVAEELFFRGALYAASPRHPVAVTVVAYALATLASGNVMLAFAAVILGVVVGLERRASGGVQAPVITHVVWSMAMLLVLPRLFG